MKKILLLVSLLLLTSLVNLNAQTVQQQLIGWQYAVPINTSNTFTSLHNDYAIRISIDTQTPIAASKMDVNGDDIRFTDSCGVVVFPHWVRSGLNTASTEIWVLVDEFEAGIDRTIYMVYGNSSASNTSDFDAVFPSSYISNGNDTISGWYAFDWFEVNAGDTIFLEPENGLLTSGIYSDIKGVLYGVGCGDLGGESGVIGYGTGGGGTSTNSGSGGGSYGGVGGTGGYDAGDTPGTGGPTYGDASSTTIELGSGGGGGNTVVGGNGGGAFYLVYQYINVSGEINVNGTNGGGGQGRNAGGGSGGGILLAGVDILITGTLSAKGGDGGIGTITANDDGGGGGGGRIKMFYESSFSISGPQIVTGGAPGTNGTTLPTAGANGTTHTGYYALTYPEIASIDAEIPFAAGVPLNYFMDSTICDGNGTIISVQDGFTMYEYFLNAATQYSGVDTSCTFPPLTDGDIIGWEATNVCGIYGFYSTVEILPNPIPVIVEAPNELHAGSQYVAFQWYFNGSIIGGATNEALTVTTSGFYKVEVTDSNGCKGMSDQINVVLGIQDNEISAINAYPNPAEDLINLDFISSDAQQSVIRIADMTGRVVWSSEINCNMGINTITIPVSGFDPGIYMITVSDNASFSTTFVKQ